MIRLEDFGLPSRKELAENGYKERLSAQDSDEVKARHFYTVSRDFRISDGSWTEHFWEVLTVNGPNAFVRIHREHGGPIERFWAISERAWYLADDAWAAQLAVKSVQP